MYHVSIELYKHEWNFGRMRNTMGTQPDRSFFQVLPTFHEFWSIKQLGYELDISITHNLIVLV